MNWNERVQNLVTAFFGQERMMRRAKMKQSWSWSHGNDARLECGRGGDPKKEKRDIPYFRAFGHSDPPSMSCFTHDRLTQDGLAGILYMDRKM
jgi:hypothetical protein